MTPRPARQDGHLIVAAIRVLEHTTRHPPMEPEIAELLGWHEDRVRVIVRGLEAAGVLSAVRTAFDVRFQVGDHRILDELPADPSAADDFTHEMEEFDARSRDEQQRLEQMLGTKSEQKENKPDPLAGDFEEFRRRKPVNPFGDD